MTPQQRVILRELGLGGHLPPARARVSGGPAEAARQTADRPPSGDEALDPDRGAVARAAAGHRGVASPAALGPNPAPPAGVRPVPALGAESAAQRRPTPTRGHAEPAGPANSAALSAANNAANNVAKGLAHSASTTPATTTVNATAPLAAAAAQAEALRAELAGLNWSGLAACAQACTRCPLHMQRRRSVFGAGHPPADWMVVGEAPGEREDAVGEPFVGPAGQLLDAMLASIGLSRNTPSLAGGHFDVSAHSSDEAEPTPALTPVCIANTVKCRPPANRNPTADEMAACAPFLDAQIAAVRPRILLAMGRFAIQRLLASEEPIGRLRGRVHQHAGIPVVVTYHPAYLLRNPLDKAKAWDDLCLAAETLAALPPRAG